MKKIKIILLLMICFITFTLNDVSAETKATQKISNVVFFIKFKGDSRDIFNAKYSSGSLSYENWDKIKKMYNENIGQNSDNSFKKYISTISEGKINVENYFPQESVDGTSIQTYTLNNELSYYQNSDIILEEVIKAINSSKINFNINEKLDNLNSGILDNMTVIVQGEATSSSIISPHKSQYSGSDLINGLRVSNYNIIPSGVLVTDDASLGVKQAQGVIAHEFLHILNFPDLYRTSGSGEPVGLWDVMGKNSSFLQYPLSYFRAKQGWIDMNYINKSGIYTLTAVSKSGGNKIFIIKTPLSDSEYIALEYRKKDSNYYSFENRIPSSGLLMYRINEKIADFTNIRGENYIYVYRPNVTDKDLGADIATSGNYKGYNLVYDAALEPDKGETEYGSTDLSLDYTNNTLYYSDGSNSGIKISDVKLSNDDNQITFKVDFADYNSEELWDTVGELDSNAYGNSILYTDKTTNIVYIAYSSGTISDSKIVIKKYNGSNWVNVGEEISSVAYPSLASFNNTLYLICKNIKNGYPTYYKLSGNTWSKVGEYKIQHPNNVKLIEAPNTLYAMYEETGSKHKLVVKDIINNKTIIEKEATDFGNPSISYYDNKLYLAYSDFFGTRKNAKIESYDIEKQNWKTEITSSLSSTNIHLIKEYNNKLYVFVGISGYNPIVYIYDGKNWSENKISQMTNYLNPSINIINENIYISYINTTDNKSYVVKLNNKSEIYDNKLGSGYTYLFATNDKDNMYAITISKNSNLIVVKKKSFETEKMEETNPKKNGLIKEDGNTYFYINDKKVVGFRENNGKTYYFSVSSKKMLTGLTFINTDYYYFDSDGVMAKNEIVDTGKGKYSFGVDGKAKTGFQVINNKTYYFSISSRKMLTGKVFINTSYYYFDENGVLQN